MFFKGFDSNLRCHGFQFAVGETYTAGRAKLCESGFHACENPLDVFSYYPPCTSRYAVVELTGISEQRQNDSKRCGTGITIVKELSQREFIEECAKWFAAQDSGHAQASGYSGHAQASGDYGRAQASGYSGHAQASGDYGHAQASGYSGHAQASGYSGHAQASGYSGHAQASGYSGHAQASGDYGHAQASGDYGHAQASGDYGHAQASGDYGHAQASGDYGHAQASGYSSVAVSLGRNAKAKASGKCKFIVLGDWTGNGELRSVLIGEVGKNIEADKWYRVRDRQFIAE